MCQSRGVTGTRMEHPWSAGYRYMKCPFIGQFDKRRLNRRSNDKS